MIVSLTFSKTCDYVTKIKDVSTAYDFRNQHNEVHVEVKNCQFDFHFKTIALQIVNNQLIKHFRDCEIPINCLLRRHKKLKLN